MTDLPAGFGCYVANIGVKDATDDLCVISAGRPVPCAAVFTKSRFAGPSVEISREHAASKRAAAIVVVSKNANVATGETGRRDALEVAATVAVRLGVATSDVLVASTGVIGRPYPMDRMRPGLAAIPSTPEGTDAELAARAIMTTDTVPKVASATIGAGRARVVGIAKGVGMIEPDMATLIAVLLTDADVEPDVLDRAFRHAIDRSLNCVSIDTDTSTSDTAVVLASGAAGAVDEPELTAALTAVAVDLARQVARDGEGATKLLEVVVDGARDRAQALLVAKAIVGSPLVKTAVHGADPNWGRVAMAIGKCSDQTDIDPAKVVIRFGSQELYPSAVGAEQLDALSGYLAGDEVRIHVSLGIGVHDATVWGCDLSAGYVRINADYTT